MLLTVALVAIEPNIPQVSLWQGLSKLKQVVGLAKCLLKKYKETVVLVG